MTDHRILPLSWTRDGYYVARMLLTVLPDVGRPIVRRHLRWLYGRYDRPRGGFRAVVLPNGRIKDPAFQLDQQLPGVGPMALRRRADALHRAVRAAFTIEPAEGGAGAWPLGDVQEYVYACIVGEAPRAQPVLTRLTATACQDGALPEARDPGTGWVRSRHWFAWPGAALTLALLDHSYGPRTIARDSRPPGGWTRARRKPGAIQPPEMTCSLWGRWDSNPHRTPF